MFQFSALFIFRGRIVIFIDRNNSKGMRSEVVLPQRNKKRKFLTWFLMLSKSSVIKSRLELDLNSHLRDPGPPLYLLSYRTNRDWRRVLTISSARNIFMTTWTPSKQGCAVFRFYYRTMPRRNLKREFLTWFLTLSKSSVIKSWLELDLNSHLRDSGPPVYLLSYQASPVVLMLWYVALALNKQAKPFNTIIT